MKKILLDKKRYYPTDLDGFLDEEILLLVTNSMKKDERYFYRDKEGRLIDPEMWNRVKVAQAITDQKAINQGKWERENTCPYCGMVLSTREAQDKECDNCGGKILQP